MTDFRRGSEWRRWDMHIHAPGTKLSCAFGTDDASWDKYLQTLEDSAVVAFGITDYFCANTYWEVIERFKKKFPQSEKVFFPNIEFRLTESVSKKEDTHVHVIFDNDGASCSKADIDRFLSELKTYGSQNGVRNRCCDLKMKDEFETASVSLQELVDALKKSFGDKAPYLIACPAKNNGMKSIDSNSPRKVYIADDIDSVCDVFFGQQDSREYFLSDSRYETGKSKPKPVIGGCDAHSFAELQRLEGNEPGYLPTWIKADLTFRGLLQITYEPKYRIYIGAEPPVEQRKATQATKFIESLSLKSVDAYDGKQGMWFKDIAIPLNPELTVIIGNKGSGKSALVDVVGLLGNTRQSAYFSFLSGRPDNKKFKQKGYAENFDGTLLWLRGPPATKNLDDSIDESFPETVRYLPQNYFEKLTNDLQIEGFRKEIEDIVFSHVEETDKRGKSSFGELQEFMTQQSLQRTSQLKATLRELNIEIVELEDQSTPLYRKRIVEKHNAKKLELKSLEEAKPKEEKAPQNETPEQQAISEEISEFLSQQEKIKEKGTRAHEKLGALKTRLQQLASLQEAVVGLKGTISSAYAELKPKFSALALDIDEAIKSEISTVAIETQNSSTASEIKKCEKDNKIAFQANSDFDALESIPDLRNAYKFFQTKIDAAKENLGAPLRKYQAYLEKIKKWEAQRVEIVGDAKAPQPGTILFLEEQLKYIDETLPLLLAQKYDDRRRLAKDIFDSKKRILNFYAELKKSVDAKLKVVKTADFSVDIDASFVLSNTFIRDFLNFINKKKRGPFQGTSDSENNLKTMISEVKWNEVESVLSFIEGVIKSMNDDTTPLRLSDQVTDTKEFYDFLFSLEYFSAKYELKSIGKNLNELSPGEKGLLLLVFYLQLDKDNIPLVIDQPEDNLDNESIFSVLAECIRKAKENRQVILVSHNPNLAIGADAEQIIYVRLDKTDNHKFSFESGSIENPEINNRIVLILEGSQPAFLKRRLKYSI